MERPASGGLFWFLNLRQRAPHSGAVTTISVSNLSVSITSLGLAILVSADNQTFGINCSERPLLILYTVNAVSKTIYASLFGTPLWIF
jgi:acyl carrier protein